MWFITSRQRPKMCKALIDSMLRNGSIAPGAVYIDEDDTNKDEYLNMDLPHNWRIVVVSPVVIGCCNKIRQMYADFPNEDWYGCTPDDVLVLTGDFENSLVSAAGSWGMASANDGHQANQDVNKSKITGLVVFGGKFIRALGYFAPEKLTHVFWDDIFETLGRSLENWRVLMDVRCEVFHPIYGNCELDKTCASVNTQEMYDEGYEFLINWLKEKFQDDVMRVRFAQWKEDDILIDRALQKSVMFGLPVYDKPNHQREAALMETCVLLTQLGIHCGHIYAHGQPIHQARNGIANAFIRSNFTDLIFIDADMSFNPWDIVRLLSSKHELVAGVGRKRKDVSLKDASSWCFSPIKNSSLVGGAFNASHVGTGFMKISRSVFEKIISKNQELFRYSNKDTGEGYYKLFAWGDDGELESGEDMNFCRLWRSVGGSVMIDPEITLHHYGQEKYSGCIGHLLERNLV